MTTTQRLTPFQRDIMRMADALNVMIPTVGAADEALTRRIVGEADNPGGERVTVHSSDISDPTANEVARRVGAQEAREDYRDSVNAVRDAIRDLQWHTDRVLRNEPAVTPEGARRCATVTKSVDAKGEPVEIPCTNFASDHVIPNTDTLLNRIGKIIEDLCDECWAKMCPVCYVRPKDQYRATCDACRKRIERQGREAA